MSEILNKIYFPVSEEDLKRMSYTDSVYAWLLLHSKFNQSENWNYIYKKEFSIASLARECKLARNTIKSRLQKLVDEKFILDFEDHYKLPHFTWTEQLHGRTTLALIRLTLDRKTVEELVKTYAFVLNKYNHKLQIGEDKIVLSYKELIETFGHSTGHKKTYDRFVTILTILQGAGILKTSTQLRRINGLTFSFIVIEEVKYQADERWIDMILMDNPNLEL